MSKQIIHELAMATQQGRMTFPQVVQGLLEVGVESYFVDFAKMEDTIYMPGGATHVEKVEVVRRDVAGEFSHIGVVAAIRAAQRDEIRYPEFARRAVDAGVVGYWAFLTRQRVVYFGRKGEFHVEEFPGK